MGWKNWKMGFEYLYNEKGRVCLDKDPLKKYL